MRAGRGVSAHAPTRRRHRTWSTNARLPTLASRRSTPRLWGARSRSLKCPAAASAESIVSSHFLDAKKRSRKMLRKKAIAHLVSALFPSQRVTAIRPKKSNSPVDRKTPAVIPGRARVPRIETRNRIPPWCERATARAARATARSSATPRWAPARCFLFSRATPTIRRCQDRTPNRVSPTRAAATKAPRRPRADAPRCTARCSSPTRPSRRSLTSP
jgi:hypothetical protein